jgi:hypothetical protein
VNRWLGIATFGIMLAANAGLFLRDIMPRWAAGEAPPRAELSLSPGQELASQIGIFDAVGRRLGYSWTIRSRSVDVLTVRSSTVLLPTAFPPRLDIARLRIDTELTFVQAQQLDTLVIRVRGLGFPVKLNGEYVPPNDFPCQWQVADRRGYFVVPAQATRALGDAVRPFQSLAELQLGQTWTIEIVNPLAALFPGWDSADMATSPSIARVTGVDWIEMDGMGLKAWVVEADRVRAWVAPTGRVLRQEVEAPLIGRLVIVDEVYDDDTRRRFLQATASDF